MQLCVTLSGCIQRIVPAAEVLRPCYYIPPIQSHQFPGNAHRSKCLPKKISSTAE